MLKTIIISLLVSAIVCGSWQYFGNNRQKISVIDAVRLFNGYHLKNELEHAEKQRLQRISSQLDSVNNDIRIVTAMHNQAATQELSARAARLKDGLQAEYERGNKELNEQVWKRLNTAIEKFGKAKGVHLIIGANGMGTVLYNDSYYDITEEAIKYTNKQYEEGN